MFGGRVEPISVQGATSYTVVTGLNREKIVQFRRMDAQLDMRMLDLARQVHGDIVPAAAALGQIGNDTQRQLAIYEMNRLPGDNYALVRPLLAEQPQSQLAVVRSLARLVKTLYQISSSSSQLRQANIEEQASLRRCGADR